ncbi:MAG: redoxin domain-containing protein [Candidatus Wallbacteria bacterium]|nr:redoxin domain-containing protein [Candidatus Wallbacteria bacterium]
MKVAPGDCPVCAGTIDERRRVVCPRCDTPHHLDCYSYNQGCAIFGCDPGRPATPLPKKGRPLAPMADFRLPAVSATTRIVLFGAVVLMSSLTILLLHSREPVRHAAAPRLQGQKARDFTLKDLDGRMRSLSSFTGQGVTVLTFWLARCPDCSTSFPKGVTLSKAFEPDEVRFVDVAYMGQFEQTAQWVKETGIKNPVLLDSKGEVVSAYGVGTYTCFVLDREGTIRYRGPVEGARAAIESLLVEKAG